MHIDILTVFPDLIAAAAGYSIVRRAQDRGLVSIRIVDLRDFASDRHRTTDDTPYGGGGGMIMKIEPVARAIEWTQQQAPETGDPHIVLTDPRGARFDQKKAREFARLPRLVLICGHYEGIDERVRRHLVHEEISIGDYVLTGGELPALVIVDAVTRLQEGALGDALATERDTFAGGLLEHPHYTRPLSYRGWSVPEILLSGHHAEIEKWRRWHRLRATLQRRPDLIRMDELDPADRRLLESPEPPAPAPAGKRGKTCESGAAVGFTEQEEDEG
ncbi:MAG TPA: tRNA (guanosine(37)-N1)-methyltransferase TrmD [Chthonomonadales bacterium]|nr:tRNA (guanosine(37)-N1)-methyltransferase TrmD [Chthonomonadales bacterium]